MNAKSLVAGAAFAAVWQVAGHYVPAAKPFEKPTVPARIGAYTYGTVGTPTITTAVLAEAKTKIAALRRT